MEKEQKIVLTRIIIAGIFLITLPFTDITGIVKFTLYFFAYLIVGYDVILEALEGIKNHEIFDEHFLMAVATIGAFFLALYFTGEYSEAVAVMLFYQLGELFQDYAVDKSRKNIISLMDIKPDYANIEINNELKKVNPHDVKINSIIIVKPGEKIPIDGKIIEGSSSIDTSALTGESIPREAKLNDDVISGCINLTGILKIKTTCEFKDSTVSKILDLVEKSQTRKSKSEKFISRFAKVYTPIVCYSALGLAIFPPVIKIFMGLSAMWSEWIYRALTFLVISCPCALVISIPLSFFAGIGAASKNGILIKGSNYLELLSQIKCLVFDKTGTLTRGVFEVVAVHPEIMNENDLLHLAAHVERYSLHPVANSLRKAYPNESDNCIVEEFEEISGYGVRAKVNGKIICAGNKKFMELIKTDYHECEECNKNRKSGTVIHIAIDNKYAGHVIISDVIKANSQRTIESLKINGIKKVVMLTGDSRVSAEEVALKLGINEYYSELLPAEKVLKLEEIINTTKLKVGFAGDGINDAPVLMRSDVGIAMGGMGSDAAIESADVVIMDDDTLKIPLAIRIAKKSMLIVKQNIYFSIGIKILCLVLSALGLAGMWLAVFADVGVMIIAVLNAVRILFKKLEVC